jgi:hypothetical protein
MGEPTAHELATRLRAWVDRLWPDPPRAAAVDAALRAGFDGDERPADAAVCAELQAVANRWSRHLELVHEPDGDREADTDPPGWPPPDPDAVARRAASVGAVTRRPDGVAVLRVDDLDAVELAAPYLEAAFRLAAGAAGVVVDLRANGGGDPGAVALVVDWVIGGPPRRISDVVYRDAVRQWWTPGRPAATAVGAGTPVAVLVSGRTYSSGEALAYHLQQRGAPVVGETTRGAADHVTPIRLARTVQGYLPEAYVVDAVSGTNWEGRGVVPDVACPAADAEDVAAERLLTLGRGPGGGS